MSRPEPDPTHILQERCNGYVTACTFLDGDTLLTGNVNGGVKVWDMKSMRSVDEVPGHYNFSVLLLTVVSRKCILSQGREGSVKVWSLDHELKLTLLCSASSSNVAFCQSSVYRRDGYSCTIAIPSASSQTMIDIVTLKDNKMSSEEDKSITVPQTFGMTMTMQYVTDSRLITGHENGSLILWDVPTKQKLSEVKLQQEPVMCLDYSHNLHKGLSGSADNKICCWKISSDTKLELTKEIEITNPGLNCIRIREDDKIFATAGWDSRIRIFSFKKLTALAVLSYHGDSVQCLNFSNSGTLVASSKDGQVTFWDLYR